MIGESGRAGEQRSSPLPQQRSDEVNLPNSSLGPLLKDAHPSPMPLTTKERDLLRRELCRHFGEDPSIADGIFLRTWRAGERRNQPKIPPAVQTMLDRGLVEIKPARLGARAFFTEAGIQELRALLRDRRAMDPERFAHLRRELGLDDEVVAAE